MALTPRCDACEQELLDFGGLLFSPPDLDSRVEKLHLCKACYANIRADMKKPR